ncbi:hypothetical protein F5Y12DRAFT_342242 [Xylaria sp. FL1777]|nr:hypothetical protein F5Y12DRAFT_342242 [Xylaria sp. FL1777]
MTQDINAADTVLVVTAPLRRALSSTLRQENFRASSLSQIPLQPGSLHDKRKGKFEWIMGGHEFTNRTQAIVIKLNKTLQFQIVAAKHNMTSLTYIANVKKFFYKII